MSADAASAVLDTALEPISQCTADATTAVAASADPATAAGDQAGICPGEAARPAASSPGELIVWRFVQLRETPDRFRQDVKAFADALPGDPAGILMFASGLVGGLGLGLVDFAVSQVKLIGTALNLLATYQAIVQDPAVWWAVAEDVIDGTWGQHLTDELERDYPDLYAAISAAATLVAAIESACAYLGQSAASGADAAGQVLQTAAVLINEAPMAIGYALTDAVIQQVVQARGNPSAQGIAVGRFLGPALLNLVLFAFGLFPACEGAAVTAAGLAEVTEDALVTLKTGLSADEAAGLAKAAGAIEPGLPAAAQAVSRVDKAAMSAYEALAYRIDAYKNLVKSTLSFNEKIRHLYGLAVRDIAYISVRLDAHHVIEAAWWKRFPEFQQLWPGTDDMPCIALHTEWHIRSGARMAEDLELFGAENETSLTTALQQALFDGKTPKAFGTPEQLLDAYEAFYRNYSTALWNKVEPVFVSVRAQLAALGK